MLKAVIHFFRDVTLVLRKLVQRVALDALDLHALTVKFRAEFLNQLTLLLLALLLLLQDGVLDFLGIGCQVIKNHSLVGDSLVALLIEVFVILSDLVFNRSKQVVQVSDSVFAFSDHLFFQVLHSFVAAFDLCILILLLLAELFR